MVEFQEIDGTSLDISETDGTDGAKFTCPYCEDYAGKADSVRGHIRAKTDPDHKGKSGFETGTEAEPANDTETVQSNAEPASSTNNQTSTENESNLVAGVLVSLLAVVWWLAQKTGNETEVNQFGEP